MDQLSLLLNSNSPPRHCSGKPVRTTQDVLTWLSAILTNQDTCVEGLSNMNGYTRSQMENRLKDMTGLVSNYLAIFAYSGGDQDFSDVPIQKWWRLMESSSDFHKEDDMPTWLIRREMRLLEIPVSSIQADSCSRLQ
uniref:Pectinesterase inhibitor domain-containing protein n=1 Tax=Nelumbo nucifera TaxID=4432 RepID=A0A822XT21_NELNU|nr:TPA_asm: hypothetical protein HUJ06_023519 [Nelumbo nucifera]